MRSGSRDKPAIRREAAPPLEPDPSCTALRLLLVDDEPARAKGTARSLSHVTRDVVHARTTKGAVGLAKENGLIAALIELRLSATDSADLAMSVRRACPDLPIVFLADRSGGDVRLPEIAGERVELFLRPFAPEWLQAKFEGYEALHERKLQVRQLKLESQNARRQKARSAVALRRIERQHALVNGALPLAFHCSAAANPTRRRFVGGSIKVLTGYGPRAFARSPARWETNIHPEDGERTLDLIASLRHGDSTTLEYRWRHADGEYRYILDHCSVDVEGNEIVGVCHDVTQRRSLEIDLHHASKLETVGRLTGGICHDFSNMLTVTINSLERLQTIIADEEEAWARTQDALHAARDCADMTRRLVHLSRREPLRERRIDLGEHLPIMLDLVKRAIGRNIEVQLDMPDDVPPVSVVRSQLDSAVLNLALNARDAMPDGGRLTVSLAAHNADGIDARACGEPEMIELAVSDTGTGMQPEILEKALDPFFTTKDENGSGLGLSMIQAFADESGGEVKIESREGKGTTVRILLPTASSAPSV